MSMDVTFHESVPFFGPPKIPQQGEKQNEEILGTLPEIPVIPIVVSPQKEKETINVRDRKSTRLNSSH